MEIVDFSNMEFNDIPKQDNPAFMTAKEWKSVDQDGCLMIVKENNFQLVVLKISPVENPIKDDSVTRLGIFWELDNAYIFANALNNKK